MNKINYLIALAFSILFIGCPVRSFSPLFTEKDLVFNADLVGSWVKEKNETLTFRKSGEKSYTAVLSDKGGDSSVYTIQLGKLGKFWFLDSYSTGRADDYHFVPMHIISRIWLEGDSIRIASLEGDWLKTMLDGKKLKIEHGRRDEEILLTASTKKLQKLVLQYAEDGEAFPTPGTFVRKK